jgi:hypothetical protein
MRLGVLDLPDGTLFEYDTPGCGVVYKPTAQSRCEAH